MKFSDDEGLLWYNNMNFHYFFSITFGSYSFELCTEVDLNYYFNIYWTVKFFFFSPLQFTDRYDALGLSDYANLSSIIVYVVGHLIDLSFSIVLSIVLFLV